MISWTDLLVMAAAVGLAVGCRAAACRGGGRGGERAKLLGRVCLIGASSGIGKQLALQLSRMEIYGLVLASRSAGKLEALTGDCNEIAQSIDKISFKACDITKLQDLKMLLAHCEERMGGVDTLIICSGVISTLPFADVASAEALQDITNSIFQINAVGPILAAKIFLPCLEQSASTMRQSNGIKPRIVVVSSASGVMAAPTRTLYTASKHALTGFFRALRMEIRGKGISICHIMPGSVDTPLRESALDAKQTLDLETIDRDEPIRSPPLNSTTSATTTRSRRTTPERKVMSPEKCASIILQSAQDLKEEVYIPKIYQLGVLVGVLFPGLIEYLARRKYNYLK